MDMVKTHKLVSIFFSFQHEEEKKKWQGFSDIIEEQNKTKQTNNKSLTCTAINEHQHFMYTNIYGIRQY